MNWATNFPCVDPRTASVTIRVKLLMSTMIAKAFNVALSGKAIGIVFPVGGDLARQLLGLGA